MASEIDRAIEQLQDERAGWVHRRDAALALGDAAAKALAVLNAYSQDSDRDVRDTVTRALGMARAGLEGVDAVPKARAYKLDELAEFVNKPGSRDLAAVEGGYDITVSLRDDRKQLVRVRKGTSQAGQETIQVTTRCGPAMDRAYKWALGNNLGLTHCGFALVEDNGDAYFDLVNSFLNDNVTPQEFKACVKEIAYYGDWAESKLTDGDEF